MDITKEQEGLEGPPLQQNGSLSVGGGKITEATEKGKKGKKKKSKKNDDW